MVELALLLLFFFMNFANFAQVSRVWMQL